MSDEQNKGGPVFGANWAQELSGKPIETHGSQYSDNKKPDVGEFALFGDESLENTDNPLLGQDEVDSILPSDAVRQKEQKGLGALVNSQRITAEKLPALGGDIRKVRSHLSRKPAPLHSRKCRCGVRKNRPRKVRRLSNLDPLATPTRRV